MLLGSVIGFGLWWGVQTVFSFFPDMWHLKSITLPFLLAGLIGWLVWTWYLIQMLKIMKALKKDPQMAEALNDEFYKAIQQKSFSIGCYVLLLLQAFLMLVHVGLYPLSALSVLSINILIGVLTPLITFLILDRESVNE